MELNKVIILFITTVIFITNAQQCIELKTNKDHYLRYEPIYLEYTFDAKTAPEGFYVSNLRDSKAMIALIIINPSGVRKEYVAPVKEFRYMEIDESVLFETLLYSKNNFIFDKDGVYALYIVDIRTNDNISNTLNILVEGATSPSDVYMQEAIGKAPSEYAMFIYLEGGDQFKAGKTILEGMFNKKTSFYNIAGAILSINSAQIKYDWKNNKIERDKNILAVEKYFPSPEGSDKIPKHLEIEAARMVSNQFSDTDLSDTMKKNIVRIAKKFEKDVQSEKYKTLNAYKDAFK